MDFGLWHKLCATTWSSMHPCSAKDFTHAYHVAPIVLIFSSFPSSMSWALPITLQIPNSPPSPLALRWRGVTAL
eukprot:1158396-Pelagomonas_calceolata.AAC.1